MLSTARTTARADRTIYVARIDELKQQYREEGIESKIEYSNPPTFTGFFVVLFVFGMVMSQWALFSGHVAAWVAGLVFSVIGISVALYSLKTSLQERDQHIQTQAQAQRTRRMRTEPIQQNVGSTNRRHPIPVSNLDFAKLESSKASA